MTVLRAAREKLISTLYDDSSTVPQPVTHNTAPVSHMRLCCLNAVSMTIRADHSQPASWITSWNNSVLWVGKCRVFLAADVMWQFIFCNTISSKQHEFISKYIFTFNLTQWWLHHISAVYTAQFWSTLWVWKCNLICQNLAPEITKTLWKLFLETEGFWLACDI